MAKVNFTAMRVVSLEAAIGKAQTIHWDAKTPGLGLRITAGGARTYIFESKLFGKTMRISIGDVRSCALDKARKEAERLKTLINDGRDPREVASDERAAYEARQMEARRRDVTLKEAWDVYIEARRSKWSELHYRDHVDLSSLGGQEKLRGKGLTEPGPLAALMHRTLSDLNADDVGEWLTDEAARRPSRARLAFNLLRIFATWCESRQEYRDLIDVQAVSTRLSKDTLPRRAAKSDSIQREQLKAWFVAVHQLANPTVEAYLVGLLLTGARREELALLRWNDVDFRWRSLSLKDKVEDAGRVIPLTPYFASLLHELKRINNTPPTVRRLRVLEARGEKWVPSAWVFSSLKSSDGRIVAPNNALHRVCKIAGVPAVTLHGLRRSFSSLAEWTETPTGVVAQIMGHKPSATAERHYKIRPLDLLRKWHDKLETWILTEACVDFEYEQMQSEPRAVAAA